MSKKVLTAEDILNESSSDDSDNSSHSSDKKVTPKKPTPKPSTAPKKQETTPVKVFKATFDETEVKLSHDDSSIFQVYDEQPEVDNRYPNIQTSKSAEATYTQRFKTGTEDAIKFATDRMGDIVEAGSNVFF